MQFSDFKLGKARSAAELAQQPVQVIAITGASNGAGKTSIAVSLAQALGMAGRRTLLLDADPGVHNVGDLLGLRPEFSLFDVLSGHKSLDEILLEGPAGVQIVPATSGADRHALIGPWECAGLVRAFSDISSPLDTLIIDTSSGVGDCTTSLCRAAGEVVVVVCNDPASFSGAVALIETLHREDGISRFRVLPSRVATASTASELFGRLLQRFSQNHEIVLSCCGFIPYDAHMSRAYRMQRSVLSAFPRSRSAKALGSLAANIMKWPRTGQAGGHLEFFVERLIQNENMEMEVRS